MIINIAEIKDIIPPILELKSTDNGKTQIIKKWVDEQRKGIRHHRQWVTNKSDENDIKIITDLLPNLLMRSMRGERGYPIGYELREAINSKQDLNYDNYVSLLQKAGYRWGPQVGAQVITDAVEIFKNKYGWNFALYFEEVERHVDSNFQTDELLTIKNIGFKVRDLALSNFNPNYVANDLHIVRTTTRIGLWNYGFDLLGDDNLEMGTNPSNEKNYLFLHKLVLKLSKLTDSEYSPVDLDRILWHFGRSVCKVKPQCSLCPINNHCLTGKHGNKKVGVPANQETS
jgi:endonuclease III